MRRGVLGIVLWPALVTQGPLWASTEPPKAGAVEIFPLSEIRPGLKGVAWTTFQGRQPEPVPVEILGRWRNALGPRQDVILARLGGKAERTNVAAGMSGSPVFIDGKLAGAISLRLSVFSPDAVCGITPIELMLEVPEYDRSVPLDARVPELGTPKPESVEAPAELLERAGLWRRPGPATGAPWLVPIETPLTFAGFHPSVLEHFAPAFERLGIVAVQGGAAGAIESAEPSPGWEKALQPGEPVAGVLVFGDMTVSGLGTVTYNDGRRVLAFGHSFFNLGPVDMPMSQAEVITVLASAYQPVKVANVGEIVGALRQDRRAAILGELGARATTIPVRISVRSFDPQGQVDKQRDFRFHVFVHQRWTPYLMMLTLFNSISNLNEFAQEMTFRVHGELELDGQGKVSLETMMAESGLPTPAPMLLANWWGEKFSKLFLNTFHMPQLRRVEATVDLLPERRVAQIETAWVDRNEVRPGEEVQVRVFLQPYRGQRLKQEFSLRVPAGLPVGSYRILLSDAETLERLASPASSSNQYLDVPQTVALLNKERSNNRLYVSLVQSRPTVYYQDKVLPNLPASIAGLLSASSTGTPGLVAQGASVQEQLSIPFDYVIQGSYALPIRLR